MGREAIMNIVAEVEKELNLTFGPEEIREVLGYTIRKAKIAGQGESYIPLLFEDELRNFAIRDAVNLLGWVLRALYLFVVRGPGMYFICFSISKLQP